MVGRGKVRKLKVRDQGGKFFLQIVQTLQALDFACLDLVM